MSSNLPPGVTPDMIPGNRPEDAAIEEKEEWALARFAEFGLEPDEYWLAVNAGLAAVEKKREEKR